VLDDFDRAEAHGDLEEGSAFSAIAQKIRGALERFGLESFGAVGDPFDPQLHEAIAQVPVPGTEQHTVLDVIERGYRLGDVELRPAKVAVAVGADG
jgi:molecular chaperone GrpE